MTDKPIDGTAVEQAIVTTATKMAKWYLDRAWALLDERVVTDAAGSVAIIAELLMEKDKMREQFTQLSISTRQPLNKALRNECPTSTDELTVAVVGLHHTGKTVLSVLLCRLLTDIGVQTKFVDEEGTIGQYYIDLPSKAIVDVLNGTAPDGKPKRITVTNWSIGQTYQLDPRFTDQTVDNDLNSLPMNPNVG